ncbi:hypothetical protein [Burkholderia sp. Ac-20353]|uniref:hypothetical protein n=1 Tax=Burkholderia sp. Ac-20353 TaxID=2703894 RepID=UPI00197C613A|nr:hypothetical protein [Burkholderia sp. Ac-20353]MBN3788313.1 hypothetical protein [Burkholderia sp. Ac-20353]
MSAIADDRPEQSEQPHSDDTSYSRADREALLDRIKCLLNDKSGDAWGIFNILSFMAEAVPCDKPDGLPVQCTLADLRKRAEALATDLGDLLHEVRHG